MVIDIFSGGRGDSGEDLSIVRANHRQIIENVMPIDGPHILTGPIAIRGAEPGDTLEVKIVAIKITANLGYSLIRPSAGALPEEFPHLEQRILQYVFYSLACNLRITQMVNRNRGVHAMVPRELIP